MIFLISDITPGCYFIQNMTSIHKKIEVGTIQKRHSQDKLDTVLELTKDTSYFSRKGNLLFTNLQFHFVLLGTIVELQGDLTLFRQFLQE